VFGDAKFDPVNVNVAVAPATMLAGVMPVIAGSSPVRVIESLRMESPYITYSSLLSLQMPVGDRKCPLPMTPSSDPGCAGDCRYCAGIEPNGAKSFVL